MSAAKTGPTTRSGGDQAIPLDVIHCGDSAFTLKQMPDACVDLAITSPPYFHQRGYNGAGMTVGSESTVRSYIDSLKEDACRLRTGHGPANSATLNVLAIAVIKRWMATHEALAPLTIAGMRRRLSHNRHEALEAMLGPAHA